MWAVPNAILGALMVFAVVLNVANVIGRYLLQSAIVSTEEILGYVLVWSVFIGVVLVTRDQEHLRMDLVSSILPPRARRALMRLERLLTIAVCSLVAFKSLQVGEMIVNGGERTMVTDLPMVLFFAALPLGFTLIVLVTLQALWRDWRS